MNIQAKAAKGEVVMIRFFQEKTCSVSFVAPTLGLDTISTHGTDCRELQSTPGSGTLNSVALDKYGSFQTLTFLPKK